MGVVGVALIDPFSGRVEHPHGAERDLDVLTEMQDRGAGRLGQHRAGSRVGGLQHGVSERRRGPTGHPDHDHRDDQPQPPHAGRARPPRRRPASRSDRPTPTRNPTRGRPTVGRLGRRLGATGPDIQRHGRAEANDQRGHKGQHGRGPPRAPGHHQQSDGQRQEPRSLLVGDVDRRAAVISEQGRARPGRAGLGRPSTTRSGRCRPAIPAAALASAVSAGALAPGVGAKAAMIDPVRSGTTSAGATRAARVTRVAASAHDRHGPQRGQVAVQGGRLPRR